MLSGGSQYQKFCFKTDSIEETIELGRLFAVAVQQIKPISLIGVSGYRDRVKSTLLFGLVSQFVCTTQEDFMATQVGGTPRVFKAKTQDGFILSYDAKTCGGDHPFNRLDENNNQKGVICVEHPQLINWENHRLSLDFHLTIEKPYGAAFGPGPREISLETSKENVNNPVFQQFLSRAQKFIVA